MDTSEFFKPVVSCWKLIRAEVNTAEEKDG